MSNAQKDHLTHADILRILYANEELVTHTTGQCDCACAAVLAISETHDCTLPVSFITSILSAWIQITDNCNLSCAYCYIRHPSKHNSTNNMSPTTGQATIDAIIRSALIHNYQTIKLKYAGGEPLLQFPLILDLHRYAQTQTKKYNLKLDGVILSNGTLLTNEIIKQMQTAHLRLMLSLDGIEAMHDCQRYYPDGHGSFKDVAKAIAKTIQEDLIPDISITVSGRNINGLPETVAWVLDHNLPFSLNFYRAHHTSDSQSNLHLDENCIIEGMLKAYKVIEHNLPDRCLLTSLVDRANLFLPHLQTCSACHNYLVFDTQGRVSKCQMDMAHPIANCYDTDPLGIIQQSKIGLQNLSVDKKTECHTCKWRYWCGGGCPRETFRTKGRYDAKSPNCNIYKALYPEVIRLESLRLSKYGKVQIAT